MELTGHLAGFFAAHAVWCVFEGETLVPMVAHEKPDGSRHMQRIVTDDARDAVEQGKNILVENMESALRSVLVYDGYVTLEDWKTDALLVEAVQYEPERAEFTLAIPYRHAHAPAGFAVYRPKFLKLQDWEVMFEIVGTAFFHGVNQHEKGAAVWNSNLDESR